MPIASHLLTLLSPTRGVFVSDLPDRDLSLADDDLRRLSRVTLDDALDPVGPQLVPSCIASRHERAGQKVGQILATGADATAPQMSGCSYSIEAIRNADLCKSAHRLSF
jgi:hypothetical protein